MKRVIVFMVVTAVCYGIFSMIPLIESTASVTGGGDVAKANSVCLDCHGNREKLIINRQQFIDQKEKETSASGEEAEESSTAEELADKLFVNPKIMGAHATLSCQECHSLLQGQGETQFPDWHAAVVADPSADGGQVCASCHGQEMIDNFKASLHFTVNGIAKGLCERLEQTPAAQKLFDEIFYEPEMYMGCNTCHATCGQCHVSNPNITGGGLLNGHSFGKPTAELNCTPCHYENSEYHLEVDVHATKHDMSCVDCHNNAVEFHGRPVADLKEVKLHYKGPDSEESGKIEVDMKSGIVQVTCVQCHEDKVQDHPVAGVDHFAKLECVACHSMPYSNCFGCHDGENQSILVPGEMVIPILLMSSWDCRCLQIHSVN